MRTTSIIVCNSYAKELEHAIESLHIPGVTTRVVPLTCGMPSRSAKTYHETIEELSPKCNAIISIPTNGCFGCMKARPETDVKGLRNPLLCLDWIFPHESIEHFIAQRKYIVSPGWLRQWRHIVIHAWGFTPEIAPRFFAESAAEIIVIDTGIYPDCHENARQFAEFAGLPYSIFPVGTQFFKSQILARLTSHFNKEEQEKHDATKNDLVKKVSEYMMIIDLVKKLSSTDSQVTIHSYIFELLHMFFAPSKLAIVPIIEGNMQEIDFFSAFDTSHIDLNSLTDQLDTISDLPSSKGFLIKLTFNDTLYGFVIVDDVLFPGSLAPYKVQAEVLAPLFGLLVSNVVNFNAIKQAHQEASQSSEKYRVLYHDYQAQNNELMEMNEELNELNAELHSRKEQLAALNATKDKFFSIISHDLRSPFASIIGLTDLMHMKIERNDTISTVKYANQIQVVATNTMSMLENLLKWSQVQTGKLKAILHEVSTLNIIQETIFLMRDIAAQKSINLVATGDIDYMVVADSEMLKTILRNLVSNAIKYTYPGGKIIIETHKKPQFIQFDVTDNGTGMDKKTASRLFEIESNKSLPGTNDETGSGLGLVLCKEFIDMQYGRIWVTSTPDIGSTFSFEIPCTSSNIAHT